MSALAPDAWVRRYLALLGIEPAPPSLPALARLTRAQALRVTFENATALLRRRAAGPAGPVPPLDPEALLATWERRAGGGVCFELAEMFGRLLAALGYEVTPIAGQISFPGSHQALVVAVAGARRLVDVSNGAPFFDPVPLERAVEVRRAGLVYRFRPGDAAGTLVQERRVDGAWTTFCRYALAGASEPERAAAYQRHHAPGESWVTGSLVLIRCAEDEVLAFRDGELTRHAPGGKSVERVEDAAAWARLPAALGVPALPLAEAARAWAAAAGRPAPPVA